MAAGLPGPALASEVEAVADAVEDVLEDGDETRSENQSERVGHTFVTGMRTVLWLAPPLERTHLVAAWALSPLESVRLSIALALESPLEGVGIRTAIEHLLTDPSPDVRAATQRATAGHRLTMLQ